jgi:hypothetical protein
MIDYSFLASVKNLSVSYAPHPLPRAFLFYRGSLPQLLTTVSRRHTKG